MNSYHILSKQASAVEKALSPSPNFNLQPYSNTGGAIVGGLGGAAAGGLAGLGRAAFDKEDDGIISTLKKVLSGGLVGGAAGAAGGVAGAHVLRGAATDRALEAEPRLTDAPGGRQSVDAALRRWTLPMQPLVDAATGKRDLNLDGYRKETGMANLRETLLHALAPAAAKLSEPEGKTTVTKEALATGFAVDKALQ